MLAYIATSPDREGEARDAMLSELERMVRYDSLTGLLNRRRFRTVKWGAMQFLLKATRESRGKKRLKHILILLMRSLAIGALVFAVARPDGRQIWVNFAHPRNDTIQVIDVPSQKIIHTFKPGPAVMHLEFTPRGHEVWISVRDSDRVEIYDTRTFEKRGALPMEKPSGIFFSARAHRIGL